MIRFLSSRRVLTEGVFKPACIAFEDGKILSVDTQWEARMSNSAVLDCGDTHILPGMIDPHVHVNEPGRTEWEGFSTATEAAAAGGCTAIVDMPLNAIPATTTVEGLETKRKAAQGQCAIDYAFWGGVVPGNADEILPLARHGIHGFKCFLSDSGVEEFRHVSEADLHLALPQIVKTGLPLLVHAELPEVLGQANARLPQSADWTSHATHLESRPPQAEVKAIELVIRLCRRYRCRVHIVHVSAAESLPVLEKAKSEGLPITAETCPHYLYFASDDILPGATQFKCAPPIRDRRNCDLLWEGLRSGVLDLVATDHSPCPPELKGLDAGNFRSAWGGISSLAVALPAVWTVAAKRGFGLEQVVHWMSTASARLPGLHNRKGKLASGFDADFVLFHPEASFEVTPQHLHSRHRLSPYLGETLRGRVERVFVRGESVYANGSLACQNLGLELRPWTSRCV